MKSINYWHPFIYSFFIRMSYRKNYAERYKAIRDLIEDDSSLIDVCCGDCRVYTFLKDKKVDYLGLDYNSFFIKWAHKRGIKARVFDIYKDELPTSDYILFQGSLYQFIPEHNNILQKLVNAMSKYLIISEPVENKAHSKSKIISFVAQMLNNPGDGNKRFRFTVNTLKEALIPFQKNIIKEFSVANNIDYIVVMKKTGKE